jgi:hypothetical protein
MAETYSTNYNTLRVVSPRGKVSRMSPLTRYWYDTYEQILVGAADDTIILAELEPQSMLDMVLSWFYHEAFTAGATLSIGWKAYKDADGVTQAASAAGLLSAADISNATGILHGGMEAVATPDDALPVVRTKDFNNSTPVTIFATIGAQAPGVGAKLEYCLKYHTMG